MRSVGKGPVWAFIVGLSFFAWSAALAADPDTFPPPLVGVWEPRLPCDTGETSDRDTRFEITSTQRLNYEEIEDVVSADLLTESPLTWRIATTSNIGPPDFQQAFIYVLQGDFLAVNDGQSARMYSRCK